MTKRIVKVITILIFCVTAAGIGVLFLLPRDFFHPRGKVQAQTRVIIPQGTLKDQEPGNTAEQMAYEDSASAKVPLGREEALVSVLTQDFNGDKIDEQIIAYRKLLEIESPIYITYIDFDHGTNQYRRVWDTITAANRPGTVNIYTQDMIGDRSICVLITGMNGAGEHTLTIFKKNPAPGNTGNSPLGYQPFNKIAEIRIDGAISVQERERSQAYQLGQTRGQSFTIAAYSRDYESPNILDQVEIIYAYNSVNGLYEQSRITRIPGTQIEQRRVRELLSAGPEEFERFIEGLWYYVGPQGTLDSRQYIYFDPKNREIIFYTDDVQQIYDWKNSSPTRYGLYVASQNISITNLRRFLNIELESLDSVQVKVFEDVHLRINVSAPWDGSYRKAKMIQSAGAPDSGSISPRFNAVYDGAIGTIAFDKNGTYELSASGITRKGKYTFFIVDNQQLLELRKDDPPDGSARETFRVESSNPASGNIYKNITLTRVRLGTKGIQELHEAAIALALVDGIGDGS